MKSPVEIIKNGGERLVIETKEYMGYDILSVRVHYFNHSEQAWRPTRKGLNMSLNKWREILPHLSHLLNEPQAA
jgi:Transcriptional Coactivator p15 (PC4)